MTKIRSVAHQLLIAVITVTFVTWCAALIISGYWLLERDVITVNYFHPRLLVKPAATAKEAMQYETSVASRGQTLYLHVDYCRRKSGLGEIRATWQNGLIYAVPMVPTIGKEGCAVRNFMVTVPHEIPGNDLVYRRESIVPVNPLRDQIFKYPDIRLRIE